MPKAAGTDCINDSIRRHICQTVIHCTNHGIEQVIRFDGFAAIRAAGNRHRTRPQGRIDEVPASGWKCSDADTGCPDIYSDGQVIHGRLR